MNQAHQESEHRPVEVAPGRNQLSMAFRKVASSAANVVGSPYAFAAAAITVIVWAAMGPRFAFSDTWQLVINTSTTIVTFLMVFLIQNTQNRDAKAMHLKLDELIRAIRGARNKLVDLEDGTDEDLQKLDAEFRQLHAASLDELSSGQQDRPPNPATQR